MGAAVKHRLTNRIWELVEPSIDGYSNLIEKLMSVMNDEQLQTVVKLMEDRQMWNDIERDLE